MNKNDFSQAALEVLLRAIQDGLIAQQENVTSNYGESMGGGGPISGGVNDRHRNSFVTHQHNLSQMPRTWWPVFEALINGDVTLHRIGQWRLPHVTNKAMLRGAGREWIVSLADVLLDVETKRRGAMRGEKPDGRMLDQLRRERRKNGTR